MKKEPYAIDVCGVRVTVQLKKMKHIRLHVLPTGEAVLSAPLGTQRRFLEDFLRQKSAWLVQCAQRMEENAPVRDVCDGAKRVILDAPVTLRVQKSQKKRVTMEGNVVTLETDDETPAALSAQYDAWLKKQALAFFCEVTDRLYPIVQLHGAARPRLFVRRMSSRWGSCTPQKGTIRLNLLLYEALPACVEAVVLHELAHLLYPDHGSAFYAFLRAHMPDYDARQKLLRQKVRL